MKKLLTLILVLCVFIPNAVAQDKKAKKDSFFKEVYKDFLKYG